MRGLILDFDGVVVDSAPEAYLVARRTYADVGPAVPVDEALPDPGAISAETLPDVLADPAYGRFMDLMPLGNRAEDFAAVLSIVERGVPVAGQADYDRERARLSDDYAQAYHARFYEIRRGFQGDHPEEWRALQPPYEDFGELLRRRSGDVTLAIATAKDRRSVGLLLAHHGLGDLFPDDRLMDKDTGRSKEAHLRRLQQALDVSFADLTFVEDKVNHLDSVAPLGVRCVLAAWGYNGPREHALARERGYLVCGLEDVEAALFDSP